MTSVQFISIELLKLKYRFSSLNFRYEYDVFDRSHVIEYSPSHIADSDLSFKSAKYDVIDRFLDCNFDEGLVFIDENDMVGLKTNPTYI